MRSPKDIMNDLDDDLKLILSRILEIEKEYQHINIKSDDKRRNKEISDKIVNVIERGIK